MEQPHIEFLSCKYVLVLSIYEGRKAPSLGKVQMTVKVFSEAEFYDKLFITSFIGLPRA